MISEVEKIARAVLYEGYLLYPYRQSALKNQQRWNFGVLYPPAWAAAQTGADRSYFQMECLAIFEEQALIDVSVRFLQLMTRNSWQEAAEQEVNVEALSISGLATKPHLRNFSLPSTQAAESGVCTKFAIDGGITISAAEIRERVFRLTVRVRNVAACQPDCRDDALMHSLVSTHAALHIHGGAFVSQIDPPPDVAEAVSACQNTGVWPVLVGDRGKRDTMLGSPIILYDYPQVAPESKGDLFDATEIDEILTLRILTLTDQEKEELRRTDERSRRILERLEASPPEHLLELHGTIRAMRPIGVAAGVGLGKGDRVRLRPRKRADIFDTLLDGKIAIIEAVEEDFEGNVHFAVVVEDDPGRDLGEMRQAGHRFFFSVEEVEPVAGVGLEKEP